MGRFARFGAAGTAGFLLDSGVLVLLTSVFGVNPFVARVPSFLAAATLTWWINRSWAFKATRTQPSTRQWLQYLSAMALGAAVNFFVYAAALIISNTAYQWPVLGIALGSIAGLAVNYLLASRLIFRPQTGSDALAPPRESAGHAAAWIWICSAPIGFGLLSVVRGQDLNWDLLNYHLYVPWAWLEGRHSVDLAAAQMQSYFPPLIDLPYFLMVQSMPGPVVGFLMGVLHGLVIIPLFAIARQVVSLRAAVVLSLAGCLGSAWLSGLGTTMGDNLAALGIVGSVFLVLPILVNEQIRTSCPYRWLIASGLALGLFVGLKITNGVFAPALILAFLLSCPGTWKHRLVFALILGLSALAGLLMTAGYWFYFLWAEFGNPLFPQFNQWFHAPLASATGIVDQSRLPDSIGQALLWPLRLLTEPEHFSEVGQRSLAWLVLMLFSVWLMVKRIAVHSGSDNESAPLTAAERFLVLFLLIGFASWTLTFSIFRYLAPLELLALLAIWVLIRRGTAARISRRMNPVILTMIIITGLLGTESWGHGQFARSSVAVEVPRIDTPQEVVLVLVGDEPQSWRLPSWPEEVAFLGLSTNFPESDQFRSTAISRLRSRQGPHLAMIPAFHDRGKERVAQANKWLEVRQIQAQRRLCQFLNRVASERGFDLVLHPQQDAHSGELICQFQPTFDETEADQTHNQEIARQNAERLVPYGLVLDQASCHTFQSRLGSRNIPYQVCQLRYP